MIERHCLIAFLGVGCGMPFMGILLQTGVVIPLLPSIGGMVLATVITVGMFAVLVAYIFTPCTNCGRSKEEHNINKETKL